MDINDVNIERILPSHKYSIGKTSFKPFVGYESRVDEIKLSLLITKMYRIFSKTF